MLKLAFNLAQRFIGLKEIAGNMDNPQILSMLKLDGDWPEHDEVPWCSAFVNYICWLLRLPRSKSLMARSWLEVGKAVQLKDAEIGDIVVLKRGTGKQPGPEVTDAPGHVGFYAGLSDDEHLIEVLGGNQSDSVKVSRYHVDRLLGVRRLV
jgi:uncharacterized protein (TIGR02594 family)